MQYLAWLVIFIRKNIPVFCEEFFFIVTDVCRQTKCILYMNMHNVPGNLFHFDRFWS